MTHPSKDFIQACNYFFTGKRQVPSNEQARIIFVFGSPGAGKSTNIKPLLLKDFAISPVCIEIDELKAFLPKDQEQDAQLTDKTLQKALSTVTTQGTNTQQILTDIQTQINTLSAQEKKDE